MCVWLQQGPKTPSACWVLSVSAVGAGSQGVFVCTSVKYTSCSLIIPFVLCAENRLVSMCSETSSAQKQLLIVNVYKRLIPSSITWMKSFTSITMGHFFFFGFLYGFGVMTLLLQDISVFFFIISFCEPNCWIFYLQFILCCLIY